MGNDIGAVYFWESIQLTHRKCRSNSDGTSGHTGRGRGRVPCRSPGDKLYLLFIVIILSTLIKPPFTIEPNIFHFPQGVRLIHGMYWQNVTKSSDSQNSASESLQRCPKHSVYHHEAQCLLLNSNLFQITMLSRYRWTSAIFRKQNAKIKGSIILIIFETYDFRRDTATIQIQKRRYNNQS